MCACVIEGGLCATVCMCAASVFELSRNVFPGNPCQCVHSSVLSEKVPEKRAHGGELKSLKGGTVNPKRERE